MHIQLFHLRIEIHILSLHWMMKNISYFNVCEALGNIKIANVYHHTLQALTMNLNPYIYILYYQSNLQHYLPSNPAS